MVKAAPASTWTSDQIVNDILKFYKYFTLSFMMAFDIMEKVPSKTQKLLDGLKPMNPYLAMLGKKEGITAAEINQNASKMAKVSEAFYKWMEKEAKAAGVSYVKEVPKPKSTKRT